MLLQCHQPEMEQEEMTLSQCIWCKNTRVFCNVILRRNLFICGNYSLGERMMDNPRGGIRYLKKKVPPPSFFTPALSYFSLVFVMEHNWQLKYPNNRSHQLSRPINYPPNPPILAELTFALLHFSLRIFDHQRSTLTEDFSLL